MDMGGAVAEWSLALKVPGFERVVRGIFSKTLSAHPPGKGYPYLFRTGDHVGGEEKERHFVSVTLLPVQVGSLTAIGWGTTFRLTTRAPIVNIVHSLRGCSRI